MLSLDALKIALRFNPNHLVRIDLDAFGCTGNSIYFYLDYLNHEQLNGNKLRKLYGTMKEIEEKKYKTIITIGGNYSNYLYACSYISDYLSVKLVFIIKGHKAKILGYTLNHLINRGADIHFYSNVELKENFDEILTELTDRNEKVIFIPEGGSNELAHIGFKDLMGSHFDMFDLICVPIGTSCTFNGIKKYAIDTNKLRGYASHKDYSLEFIGDVTYDYNFGGFAKMTPELMKFVNDFYTNYQIPLDPIYTSKMLYGIIEDFKKGVLSGNKKILAIHTGGLQGWNGIQTKPMFLS